MTPGTPGPPGEAAGGGGDRTRLTRLLGGPDLAWLVTRLRARLEAGDELTATLTLRGPTPDQRAAVAQLFGTPPRTGATLAVRSADLDALLRSSGVWPQGLEDAVVALTGPYVRRGDAARARRTAFETAWAPLLDALAHHRVPALRQSLPAWWRGELSAAGTHRAAPTPEAAAALARDLAAVLVRLPADGVAIGSLAHAATGRAHALDRGPLATLVLRAARVITGEAVLETPSAEADRRTWAAVGVVRDETSSTVLCLGLPVAAAGATATGGASDRALAAWGQVVQPVLLTLRQLRLDPPTWRPPVSGEGSALGCGSADRSRADRSGVRAAKVVWVVENPVVLTAVADRSLEQRTGEQRTGEQGAGEPRRGEGPAVVCTSGWPSAAAVAVLRGLRAAGWQLRHHGDLDPDGLAITDWLVREVGVSPWRMAAADYRAALAAGLGRPVAVQTARASWDPELAQAMRDAQQVVEEEAVLADLVDDVVGDRR